MTSSAQKTSSVNWENNINKGNYEAVKHKVEIPVKLNYNVSRSQTQADPAVRHTVELQVNLALDFPINLQTDTVSTDVKNIEVLSTAVKDTMVSELGNSYQIPTAITQLPTVSSENIKNPSSELDISQSSQGPAREVLYRLPSAITQSFTRIEDEGVGQKNNKYSAVEILPLVNDITPLASENSSTEKLSDIK